MLTNQKKQIAAYVRASSKADANRSLDEQITQIRSAMDRDDAEIIGVYRDETHGRGGEQPELQRLCADLAEGRLQVDAIAVAGLDRLSRTEAVALVEQLSALSVDVIDVTAIDELAAAS